MANRLSGYEYWRDNAYRYNWTEGDVLKNFTEYPKAKRQKILKDLHIITGEYVDLLVEDDLRMTVHAAFLIRYMTGEAIWMPQRRRVHDEIIEPPSV